MQQLQPFFMRLFSFCAQHRSRIILIFKLYYGFIFFLLIAGVFAFATQDPLAPFFVQFGRQAADGAIITYILTIIPGIAHRLRIHHPLVQLLMLFRRYYGILTFLLIFVHVVVILCINIWYLVALPKGIPLALYTGIAAYLITMVMFLTSNDFSVKILGPWWEHLQHLTYILIGFIFLHLAFRSPQSIWTVLSGVGLLTQLFSHVYVRISSPGEKTAPPSV